MGDLGSIPGLGRSPGEENGDPLQYSCLENPMDGGSPIHSIQSIHICVTIYIHMGFPGGSVVKDPSSMQEMQVQPLGQEDLL